MSYEIVYDRQFLKTADGKFIPLTLHGSNNCYEPRTNGRERRTRYWDSLFTGENENIALAADELRTKVKSWTGGAYQEHFRYHGKWVDDAGLLRFAENGIKAAKTVEELNLESVYKIYLSGSLSIWFKDGVVKDGTPKISNRSEMHCTICTSADLDAFLARAQERLEQKSPDETIFVQLKFPGDRAVEFPRLKGQNTKPVRLDQFYAIKIKRIGGDNYIKKLTASRLQTTYCTENCKQFRSQSDAQKWLKEHRIEERFRVVCELAYFDMLQKAAM